MYLMTLLNALPQFSVYKVPWMQHKFFFLKGKFHSIKCFAMYTAPTEKILARNNWGDMFL